MQPALPSLQLPHCTLLQAVGTCSGKNERRGSASRQVDHVGWTAVTIGKSHGVVERPVEFAKCRSGCDHGIDNTCNIRHTLAALKLKRQELLYFARSSTEGTSCCIRRRRLHRTWESPTTRYGSGRDGADFRGDTPLSKEGGLT